MSKQKKTIFTGAATAVITPFSQGQVDYASFGRIIEDQIAKKIDAIVVAGTTGEAATLTHESIASAFALSSKRSQVAFPLLPVPARTIPLTALSFLNTRAR